MTVDATTKVKSAKYDVAVVEQVVLELVISLHPRHFRRGDLFLKIAEKPTDKREAATATRAIDNLVRFDLLRYGRGNLVEPTEAALHAGALLMGCTCETAECQCYVRHHANQVTRPTRPAF